MDYFNHLQKDVIALMGSQGRMFLCMGLGVLSILVLLWSAKPGRARKYALAGTGSMVVFGLVIAVADSSAVFFQWMKYASAVGTPLVVWWLARECWTGYLTPWTFSWGRIGLVMLAILAMGYLLVKTTPNDGANVTWVYYCLMLLLSPLFAFKALMWWTLTTLKRVYVGKYTYEKESTKTVDVYFTAWWNDKVRGRKVDQEQWLALTKQYPQFIESRWWQKKGAAFWPDMMEWDAKLGTLAMLWFIQQRMDSPPEVLDDYSDAEGIFSFSDGARIGLAS